MGHAAAPPKHAGRRPKPTSHCWLLDPLARTLEAYELREGKWLLLASHGGNTRFRAPPFDAVEFELGAWWLPEDDPPQDAAG